MDLKYFILAYLSGTILTFGVSLIYTKRNLKNYVKKTRIIDMSEEIMKFSSPLWAILLLSLIVNSISILALGYFQNPESVGSFRIAHALSSYVGLFLGSAGFLYVPIISYFCAQNKLNEIKEVYVTITKWIFLISFPLFLVIFMFPSEIITLIYTSKYTDASFTLQILGSVFIIHAFLGPNMNTLIALGNTKLLSYVYVIETIISVIFAIALIPIYGLTGAAITVFFAISIVNIITSIILYKDYKIHPFKKHYVLPTIITLIISLLIYQLYIIFLPQIIWAPLLFFPLFIGLYFFIFYISRSITKIDKAMMRAIYRKLKKSSSN